MRSSLLDSLLSIPHIPRSSRDTFVVHEWVHHSHMSSQFVRERYLEDPVYRDCLASVYVPITMLESVGMRHRPILNTINLDSRIGCDVLQEKDKSTFAQPALLHYTMFRPEVLCVMKKWLIEVEHLNVDFRFVFRELDGFCTRFSNLWANLLHMVHTRFIGMRD